MKVFLFSILSKVWQIKETYSTRTCTVHVYTYVDKQLRFRYLNIFQLAEKTASQGWTPALAPRRGTAPRSWRARGDKMEGREVVRAFHWMLWNLSVDARIPTLLFTRVCLILPYFRNILLNCCFMINTVVFYIYEGTKVLPLDSTLLCVLYYS